MVRSVISGTGSYLPARVVSNDELAETMDTSDEWISERSGIRQRHIAAADETTCDLAFYAAERAIEAAQINVQEIDLIILATTTPNQVFPATACMVQARLGVSGCPAFDVQAVCAGFIYALSIADKFIRAGGVRNALVIGAETFTRILNWDDRATAVLFGDGAGAVVLSASDDQSGIYSTHLHADGQMKPHLQVPGGVSQGYESLRGADAFVSMNGREVFRFAVGALAAVVEEALNANGLEPSAIDWLIPHQANLRIIKGTAKKLGLPLERVVISVDQHANTSAASIPLALDLAVRDGRIQRGQLLLLEGIGGGFAWGSALVRY